jgi:glutathione S-transferase
VLDELAVAERAEVGLRVAGVDDEEHRRGRLDSRTPVAATLYAVPASHPCAAVEKALQLKGVEYRRVDVPPVAHKAIQYALFGGSTVPGLVLDGEKILGSRKIMARSGRTRAGAAAAAGRREGAQVGSGSPRSGGDEVLQPLVRRVIWLALRRSPASMPSYGAGSRLPIPDVVSRLTAPLVARAEQRINAGSELNVRADLAALDHHLARVERWMAHGRRRRLVTQRRRSPDRVGARAAAHRGDVADALGSRDAFSLARRWFPDYPGSVPSGVLPAEWFVKP